MIPNLFSSRALAAIGAVLLAALVVQTVRIEGLWCRDVAAGDKPACIVMGFRQQLASVRIDLVAARARTETEIARHRATKQAYAEAQAEAARMEAERIARVTAEQQEITDDTRMLYQRRLDDARARYERLRRQVPATGAGAAGPAYPVQVPIAGGAAGRAAEAPGQDGLSLDERMTATAQALQLEALIDWVEQQLRVRRD